ncbi:GNAT family N-acetyltransferase [Floricoccus penangensis]|uniref:GNAT family N-acetyltransferase n=1 Tax=Floricoccus penangensis TaxID=1859475 RepID=UPI00203FA166|nr:GNAT family N-acetyltransferase [Floricoccus penangensis]URZ88110.1 GNAT family N-acetyltransferase [Floricoccus penangensis]
MKIDYRLACIGDEDAISKVHVDAWREAYIGIVNQEYLNNLKYEDRKKMWTNNLKYSELPIYLAVDEDDNIIGFSSIEIRDGKFYLATLYLLEKYHKKGIGQILLDQVLNYAKSKKYQQVYLEVLSENPTVSFYQKNNFKIINNKFFTRSDEEVEEYVMKLEI